MVEVSVAYRLPRTNRSIEQRLRERRFVGFTVTQLSIAEQVDDDVLLERASKIHRQGYGLGDSFRILAIHMEDRNLQHLCDIGTVSAGCRLIRRGRKRNLVI